MIYLLLEYQYKKSPQPIPQFLENQGNHEKCACEHRARCGDTYNFEIPIFRE